MFKKSSNIWKSFLLFLVSGCVSKNDYTHTVNNVELNKYMGKWYVIAARPTIFEKGAFNSIEQYTWNDEKKRIDIDFSYTKDSLEGPIKHIYQKGWVTHLDTNAYWQISPLWPLKFDYLIIALDPDYQWTVVGVPSQKYIWIMSRQPQISNELFNKIKEIVNNVGYSTENMQMIEHSKIKN